GRELGDVPRERHVLRSQEEPTDAENGRRRDDGEVEPGDARHVRKTGSRQRAPRVVVERAALPDQHRAQEPAGRLPGTRVDRGTERAPGTRNGADELEP